MRPSAVQLLEDLTFTQFRVRAYYFLHLQKHGRNNGGQGVDLTDSSAQSENNSNRLLFKYTAKIE